MKIRLTDHFIRIRISPEDAQSLRNMDCIHVQLQFGDLLNSTIKVGLVNQIESAIQLENGGFEILLPKDSVNQWLSTTQEKIKWQLGDAIISLEKDYPCEHQLSSSGSTFQRPQ
jgi:citrate lyase gamma subunit